MTTNEIKNVLLWCTVLNYAVLFIWFRDLYFCSMTGCTGCTAVGSSSPVETFDALNYGGLAVYKIGIFLLNLMPLTALYLAS